MFAIKIEQGKADWYCWKGSQFKNETKPKIGVKMMGGRLVMCKETRNH